VIDSQGKYMNHISEVAKKCNRITGMIKTRFKSRHPNLLSQLYKVYILPIIGYASEVWAPTYKIQLEFLEKIQKRYCRLTGSKSYSGSCKALSLITVEDFLKHKDLKYMHKIMSNNTCLNFNDFFKTSVKIIVFYFMVEAMAMSRANGSAEKLRFVPKLLYKLAII
jgi:hypothetical protein